MFIDELLTRYESKEDTFKITLPGGEELEFRYLNSYSEIRSLRERAVVFANKMLKGEGLLPSWTEFLADDIHTYVSVFILADTIKSPKLEQLDFLRLSKKAGHIFAYIIDQYNMHEVKHIVTNEVDTIEQLKKD